MADPLNPDCPASAPAKHLAPRTIGDPEFPDDPEERLYFVMVELNIEDVRELKRVTEMELSGTLDKDGVKAFVEAGLGHRASTQGFQNLF